MTVATKWLKSWVYRFSVVIIKPICSHILMMLVKMMIILISDTRDGIKNRSEIRLRPNFYLLSGLTSNCNISRNLEAARSGFRVFQSLWIRQPHQRQRCGDTCQISERYNHYNISSHGFEASRDLAVSRTSSCLPIIPTLANESFSNVGW